VQIDQLRYFLETARRGHLGEAARALHVTPSAVSHGIARLEEELAVELFRKQGRKLALTGEGNRLLEEASDVLGRLDRLHEIARKPAPETPLRIAAAHGLASEEVARAFGAAWAEGAFRVAELSAAKSADILLAAARGEIDLGICFSPLPHPDVGAFPLHEGALVLVVRRGHPLGRRGKKSVALTEYPAVLPKGRAGIENCERHPALAKLFERAPTRSFASCQIDSYEVAASLVAATDAWALIPDFLARRWSDRLVELPKTDGWDARYRLEAVHPRSRPPSERLRAWAKSSFGGARIGAPLSSWA
jgi:DNA-binding transcriptional LysR family regulator